MNDKMSHNPFGITKNEMLWDEISYEHFIEILGKSNVKAIRCERDANTYGDFRFLTLLGKTDDGNLWHLSVYGMGFHEHRETHVIAFKINDCHGFTSHKWEEPGILKTKVKAILAEEYADYSAREKADDPGPEAELFGMLADLTDDDGAMSEMSDIPSDALRGLMGMGIG